ASIAWPAHSSTMPPGRHGLDHRGARRGRCGPLDCGEILIRSSLALLAVSSTVAIPINPGSTIDPCRNGRTPGHRRQWAGMLMKVGAVKADRPLLIRPITTRRSQLWQEIEDFRFKVSVRKLVCSIRAD